MENLPIWKVFPHAQSRFFNIRGLAYKVVLDMDASFAESNRDMYDLQLYDPVDDDNVEAFRRTFTNQYQTNGWAQLDPRSYALRYGLGSYVTSPAMEIADDLTAVRLGMRHRVQTKRGMPGKQQIVDYMTFDTNAVLFPKKDRDNFGEYMGLIDYDFRWHIGDRTTFTSDAMLDLFDEGQKIMNAGFFINRPPRGNFYCGMRIAEGPIKSRVATASYNYWMTPKWLSSFGFSYDFGDEGNIGQNFQITRVGESLLVSLGCNVDHARDNVGINFAIEPRFLPKGRLRNVGGARVPIAGEGGLE